MNLLAYRDVVNQILAAIKRETGVDAVGIRLRSGDDFPYFVQSGFSHEFLAYGKYADCPG